LTTKHLWMHRNEAALNPHLPHDVAPKLLAQVERDGWLLLVFEHAPGRHANLSPRSTDLPLIAQAVSGLSVLNPDPAGVRRSLFDHWSSLRAWHRLAAIPHLLHPADTARLPTFLEWEQRALPTLDGTSLAHTDLHSLNILVAPDRGARFVDWGWARRAPIWIDPALLVLRLIEQGHTPQHAEQWATQIPSWATATDSELTGFAVATLGVWEHLRIAHPLPMRERLSDAARQWVNHRLPSE